MKSLGILLIVAGLLLFAFTKMKANAEEKLMNNYPSSNYVNELEIPKWPAYAGLGISGLGALYLAVGKRKHIPVFN